MKRCLLFAAIVLLGMLPVHAFRGYVCASSVLLQAENGAYLTENRTQEVADSAVIEPQREGYGSSVAQKTTEDDTLGIDVLMLMIAMFVLPLGIFIYLKIDVGLGGYILMAFLGVFAFVWNVVTLKHLRLLINRLRYKGFGSGKSKYLPMMGGIVETQMLRRQITPVRLGMKGRLWKAVIWRMVAHGDLSFGRDSAGNAVLVPTWNGGTGDGMDRPMMQYVYDILAAVTAKDSGSVTPMSTVRAIYGTVSPPNGFTQKIKNALHAAEELMFLLRTDVKLNRRKRESVRQIYAFRRYLKGIRHAADPSLDLARLWGEYVSFACLFGIESQVLRDVLSQLYRQGRLSGVARMLADDEKKVSLVRSVARAAAIASPLVNIQGIRSFGFLPVARIIHEHLDEPLS